ncbi:hypothetical protein EVAR_95979_1 [Eumeta japonica]|uniref:Uncharacterized protein n=1 Tax=Eumeta variegata TaxID=151549 RepID=A0A4C1VAD4_EUMVA|nr:hypothetical protein EVAR_95979_1 [Eumeta japonica]
MTDEDGRRTNPKRSCKGPRHACAMRAHAESGSFLFAYIMDAANGYKNKNILPKTKDHSYSLIKMKRLFYITNATLMIFLKLVVSLHTSVAGMTSGVYSCITVHSSKATAAREVDGGEHSAICDLPGPAFDSTNNSN